MKFFALSSIFFLLAIGAFGSATVHTLDFGSYTYSRSLNGVFVSEVMEGANYRFTYYPNITGFYTGVDYTMAYPISRIAMDGWSYSMGSTPYRSYLQLMVPFGYRWAGKGNNTGFYLGGGPSGVILYGTDAVTQGALGLTLDLGIETNKTEGSAFHFGWQSGWNPLVFESRSGRVDGSAWTSSIRFGISWRRIAEK